MRGLAAGMTLVIALVARTADRPAGPVAALRDELAQGRVALRFEPGHGYLTSLLDHLEVPISSQALVFSKTSVEPRVSPRTPRALYFNDAVTVGWVPGAAAIEIGEADPVEGAIFYTIDQRPDVPPALTRRDDCQQCHNTLKTLGVPGHLMGSTMTATDGRPLQRVDQYRGGHRSPLDVRWGGWYVTGTTTGDRHLGNTAVGADGGPVNVRENFDRARYLSPHSDVVALLVLEHQVRMRNLITRAHQETLSALDQDRAAAVVLSTPPASPGPQARARIDHVAEELLEYMLFRDEAPLRGRVIGTSTFARDFQRAGLRDAKGRSLRDLDLQTRLFRYPCSFLIDSPSFDALPRAIKERLWSRLHAILSGADTSPLYAGMARHDREAVLEILRDTKPDFAAWIRRQ